MTEPRCRYFRKPCLQHGCTHWVRLQGADAQTGRMVDEWMCTDLALVKIALEGNKEIRQIQAAVNSAAADTSRLTATLATPRFGSSLPSPSSPDPALEDLT